MDDSNQIKSTPRALPLVQTHRTYLGRGKYPGAPDFVTLFEIHSTVFFVHFWAN